MTEQRQHLWAGCFCMAGDCPDCLTEMRFCLACGVGEASGSGPCPGGKPYGAVYREAKEACMDIMASQGREEYGEAHQGDRPEPAPAALSPHQPWSCGGDPDDCRQAWCATHHGELFLCAVCGEGEAGLASSCPGPKPVRDPEQDCNDQPESWTDLGMEKTEPALVGFDYETVLFGPGNLTPQPICLSTAIEPEHDDLATLPLECVGLATLADGDVHQAFLDLLDGLGQIRAVGCNLAFDLSVAAANIPTDDRPGLYARIMDAIVAGHFSDVMIREKLLNLTETGRLKFVELPDGSTRPIYYGLADLAKKYLNVSLQKATISDGEVEGGEADDWRLNYEHLADVALADWPAEAAEYAVKDSIYPVMIHQAQEERRARIEMLTGHDPLRTEHFRLLAAFSLQLFAAPGVCVDQSQHARIRADVERTLDPANFPRMLEEEILIPATPPRPYANNAKAHEKDCADKKNCNCPLKMTGGTKEKFARKKFTDYVLTLVQELGEAEFTLRYNEITDAEKDKAEKEGRPPERTLKLDKEFLEDHELLDPLLAEVKERQSVMKIYNTELPRMEWPHGSGIPSAVVHPNHDILKETGRISAYASKAYPSFNSTNVHPAVRRAFVARPRYVLYSVDFTGMELGTFAQTCYSLFGASVLRDVINAGKDAHAVLGTDIALELSPEFGQMVERTWDDETTYNFFKALDGEPEFKPIYKKFRNMAKPTGLGYPGGLGAKTFCQFAHSMYRIEVDEPTAVKLKDVWGRRFPEGPEWLKWINYNAADPRFVDKNGRPKFAYTTPLGMYRPNASYCAAANGMALQSPSAEGALLSVCAVAQETYAGRGLLAERIGDLPVHRPLMFIHDEIVGEAHEDVAHEVAHEVARLMVEAFSQITPDVLVRAEPVLMRRWNKNAQPVFENGRLVPWIDKEQA